MSTLAVRRHGNSVGVTFPAETRIRMGFEVGQELNPRRAGRRHKAGQAQPAARALDGARARGVA